MNKMDLIDIHVLNIGLLLRQFFDFLTGFYLVDKNFSRLEAGYKVFFYYQSGVSGNISGNFSFPFLINKTTEAPDIKVMAVCH